MTDNKKLDNTDLRSEEVQEILTRVPHWMIRWGSVLFLSLIILLLFISWFVKYPDVIVAQAIITTEVPPQKEYAQYTGKIDTIFVEDDQIVYKGQPLAILENTANFEHVFFLKSVIDTVGLKNGKFNFPLMEVPILFLGEISTAYSLFENSYIQYSMNKKLQPFANELIASRVSLSELRNRLHLLLNQQKLEEKGLKLKENELRRKTTLFKKGIISEQEFEAGQLEYLQSKQGLKNVTLSISQIREAIAVAKKTAKGTTIEKERETMNLLKSVVQRFNQLKVAIEAWEMKYVLSSEIDGKVAFMNYWSENQTVTQGDLIFTIIPAENSAYVAKLLTPAENSGKIEIGQEVKISLKNYSETEFGVLEGKIEDISLLPNKEGLYLIDVSMPEELITSYGKRIKFKQEMAGTANIITEDLRLIERFFYQLKDIFNR